MCSALIILQSAAEFGASFLLLFRIVLLGNWIEKALTTDRFEARAVLQLEFLISFLLIYKEKP